MTNSRKENNEAFVWIWLPKETTPIVAGRLETENGSTHFNYGRSYLERVNDTLPAMAIYEKELPLKAGVLPLLDGLTMPGCIRDAAPDAWGRRVIMNKRLGAKGSQADTEDLDELTYLLESGSDRIGALDFQHSATVYEPRCALNTTLEELQNSAERVEKGIPLTEDLDRALFHGSSIGGARPKALIEDIDKKYVAKFASSSDLYSVVKAEFIAMRLAALAGLDVAPVHLTKSANKDILLIERFDRVKTEQGWQRKIMVSALTLFEFDDMNARYASYEDLAGIIRHTFDDPGNTLRELFSRLAFNILCGNNDDHARNHAAFWNGKSLSLTPAYDICPQNRTGFIASQAMRIVGHENQSQRATCLKTAHNFLLSEDQAMDIFETQQSVIENNWDAVCEEAELSQVDKEHFFGRQFLNPFVFQEPTR